jgi:glycosyltransferase involved in cell wall biosynthesis
MKPRVSVVITAYNNEPFVETAIRSVLDQDYQDYELIVVEDRGRDRTYEIAKRFAGERVQVIRNERNHGHYGNKNEGMRFISGDLVKFVDADDYLLPGALSQLVSAYDAERSRPSVIFARPRIVDEQGRPLVRIPGWGYRGRAHGPSLLHFLATKGNKGSCLCNVTPHLFDRASLDRVGGFPDSNAYAGDWQTFLKLLAVGDAVFTDAVVAGYRIQAESISRLTPIVPQARDGIQSMREVAAFAAENNPEDERFRSEAFRSGLLDSFVDRYVHPQRMRKLLGRSTCDAELRDLFAQEGLEDEFSRMVGRGFLGYIALTLGYKARAAVGLSPYTPALAGFRRAP